MDASMKMNPLIEACKKNWTLIVYVGIGVCLRPQFLSWSKQLLFFLYFIGIFFILRFLSARKRGAAANHHDQARLWGYILFFAFVFLLVTRLIPFYQFGEAPLGYDTGFYHRNFLANALTSQSAYYLNLVPFHLLGMSPLFAISFVYVLSQILIAGGLYFLLRTPQITRGPALATIGVLFFSLSVMQFYAYWWMLGQQMLAMGFLFITIGLLFRKPTLAIVTGAMGLLIHLPTFAIFGLVFFLFFVFSLGLTLLGKNNIDRQLFYLFGVGAFIVIVATIFKYDTLSQYVREYLLQHRATYNSFPFWEIYRFRGAFLQTSTLHITSLILIPFTAYGFLHPCLWRLFSGKNDAGRNRDFIIFLYVLFVCLSVLVYLPVIYQQRFMIVFDLLIIIFAAPAILLLINYFLRDKIFRALLLIFVLFAFWKVGLIAWQQQPHIPPDELAELENLSYSAESSALVVATNSFYTPWVYGFSGRNAYGPGTLPDPWDYDTWMKFWFSDDDQIRLDLLSEIDDQPLYLFIGAKQRQAMPFQKFIESAKMFNKVSPHIWKFAPAQ